MISILNIRLLTILLIFGLMPGCSYKKTKAGIYTQVDKPMPKNEAKPSEASEEVAKSEDWICDTILSLDEVKKESRFLEKKTKGKRHLSVAIYTYPDATNNYYWVKAWEDNGDAFATHFNFYVYPNPKKILFYDTLKDTLLDLQMWRKSYKYFNFK